MEDIERRGLPKFFTDYIRFVEKEAIEEYEEFIDDRKEVATPTANPNGGAVIAGDIITLSCATEGAVIYYTTDGTTPTSESTLYVDGIEINEATTVKAIAVRKLMTSEVLSVSYTMVPAVVFSELDTYLKSLAENTASTPYKIKVTGLTKTDCGNAATTGTLGNVIYSNNKKYVDLSYTELPNDLTDLTNAFAYCGSLIVAPPIPNGVQSLNYAYTYCESLVNAPTIPNGVQNINSTFEHCGSLISAIINLESVNPSRMQTLFWYCNNLQDVYVTSEEIKATLIANNNDYFIFPKSLDLDTVIKVMD